MALDFPNAPVNGQVFTGGLGSWIWDGAKWNSASPSGLYLPLVGGTLNGPGNLTVAGGLFVGATTAPTPNSIIVEGINQQTASWDTNGAKGGTIQLWDVSLAAGAGGAVTFAANSGAWKFAAIKGYATDGSSNSHGDIVFSTRRVSTDTTLTEGMRLFNTSGLSVGNLAGLANQLAAATIATATFCAVGSSAIFGNVYLGNTGTPYHYAAGYGSAINMNTSGGIQFYSSPSQAAGVAPVWTQTVGINPSGNVNAIGELQSTFANSCRIAYGGAYGTFWRNDASNLYLMITNNGDPYGTWNGLRPLTIGLTNGTVSIGNGLYINGGGLTINNGNLVLANAAWYQGKDTAGTVQNMMTLWSDNAIYVCESSRVLYLRGSAIHMQGTVDTNGNVAVGGSLTINGSGALYNDGASKLYCQWAYRAPNLYSDGGIYIGGGSYNYSWTANGGWIYTPQPILSGAQIQANNGTVASFGGNAGLQAGDRGGGYTWMFYSSGNILRLWDSTNGDDLFMEGNGWLHCKGGVRLGGYNAGVYWYNYSGWNRTDSSIYCGGILPTSDNGVSSGLSGNAWAQCAAYWFNNPSDERLKQDIEPPSPGALAAVLALSPMQYHYRRYGDIEDDPLNRAVTDMSDEPLRRGFLAHDVRAVLGEKFGGWREDGGIQALSYNDLLAVLWQAVQELAKIVEGK